jgi:hypothetical protein
MEFKQPEEGVLSLAHCTICTLKDAFRQTTAGTLLQTAPNERQSRL